MFKSNNLLTCNLYDSWDLKSMYNSMKVEKVALTNCYDFKFSTEILEFGMKI